MFGKHAEKLAISSTKSMHGHPLGAGGGIEAVACIKAMQENWVPPTAGLDEADPECDLDYVPNVGREKKVTYAMSNSFAFGGLNAVLVFGPAAGLTRPRQAHSKACACRRGAFDTNARSAPNAARLCRHLQARGTIGLQMPIPAAFRRAPATAVASRHISLLLMTARPNEQSGGERQHETDRLGRRTMREIVIRAGKVAIRARLLETPTAERIWAALPIHAEAKMWGREVYFNAPVTSDREPGARDIVNAGRDCLLAGRRRHRHRLWPDPRVAPRRDPHGEPVQHLGDGARRRRPAEVGARGRGYLHRFSQGPRRLKRLRAV